MVHQQLFDSMGLEYGFLAQKGHVTGLTVSPLMASLYPEMRNLKIRHSSNCLVVILASRMVHTAVFTNTGLGSYIDLDSIVFETQISSTNPVITYSPAPDWVFTNMQGCFNDTLHFTQTGGAQARFAFNGDAVAIYGAVSLADYTVTTDGVPQSFQSCSDGLTSNVHVGVSMLGRRQAAR
jgi:hypothetical protein